MNVYLVNIEDRGSYVCLEVTASSVSEARKLARQWHPYGRVVSVERIGKGGEGS